MITVEELLTREEIRQVRLDYSAYMDTQDLDGMVGLFTEDAVCHFGPEFGGDWVGRAQIRENYARNMKLTGGPFDALHVITNPVIEITGSNTARGRWYLMDLLTRQHPVTALETRGGHGNPLLYLAIYADDYRKDGEVRRIARTKLHFLWPERTSEDFDI